jgi:hypothetical protein
MRELSDGRVMVIDNVRSDRTVWSVDFRDNTMKQFGRRGRGPVSTSSRPVSCRLVIPCCWSTRSPNG